MPPVSRRICPDWVFLNDANVHVARDIAWFKTYTPFASTLKSRFGGSGLEVHGIGTVTMTVFPTSFSKATNTLELENVLHVPEFMCNVIGNPITKHDGKRVMQFFINDQTKHTQGFLCDPGGAGGPLVYFLKDRPLLVAAVAAPTGTVFGPPVIVEGKGPLMLNCYWEETEMKCWREYRRYLDELVIGYSNYTLVNSVDTLAEAIDDVYNLPVEPPSLYVDLEGVPLSRHGSIAILKIHALPIDHTYLIDIYLLGAAAFSTKSSKSKTTLKMILEAKFIPKVFFDVRNDSDALHHHYQISLDGVQDIQLMELATRSHDKKYVAWLQKCIDEDAGMTESEMTKWNVRKEKGAMLCVPEKGGRHELFHQRPLADELINYCIQDVQCLPRLWSRYHARITSDWTEKLQVATEERIRESQSASYDPHSPEKAKAPGGWRNYQGSKRAHGQTDLDAPGSGSLVKRNRGVY